MKAWWRAAALVVAAAVIAVIADPAHRATIARVMLLVAAVAGIAALIHVAERRTPPAPASPFDPTPVGTIPPPVPYELARMAADLDLYAGPHGPRLGSGVLDGVVKDIVVDRLARHRGLVVPDPAADPPGVLGPATRALLQRRRQLAPIEPGALAAELEAL